MLAVIVSESELKSASRQMVARPTRMFPQTLTELTIIASGPYTEASDMTVLRTHHVTDNFIEVDKPIKLETTPRTRRLFLPSFFEDSNGTRHLRGTFVHQKKGRTGWEDEAGVALRDLKAGDTAKFDLGHAAMNNFLDGISVLLKTAEIASPEERSERFSVALQSKSIEIKDETLKPIIDELINKGLGSRFWNELASMQPGEAQRFADQQILARRRASVCRFEDELKSLTWDEPQWGRFFDENRWIFGLGLRYQFLSQLQGQAHYGGADLTGRGTQKGDYLHHTEGHAKFIVLVEIKRPDSPIFQPDSRGRAYRNGVPGFDVEFANALSQVQVNARTWELEGSRTEPNRTQLEPQNIYTVHPRSLLIYGCTTELTSLEKRNCFEIFRGQLKNTGLVAYDELLARARFIVGEMAGMPLETADN
jgi:hypothetical protein